MKKRVVQTPKIKARGILVNIAIIALLITGLILIWGVRDYGNRYR